MRHLALHKILDPICGHHASPPPRHTQPDLRPPLRPHIRVVFSKDEAPPPAPAPGIISRQSSVRAVAAVPPPAPGAATFMNNLGDLSGWDPTTGAQPPETGTSFVAKLLKKTKVGAALHTWGRGWGRQQLAFLGRGVGGGGGRGLSSPQPFFAGQCELGVMGWVRVDAASMGAQEGVPWCALVCASLSPSVGILPPRGTLGGSVQCQEILRPPLCSVHVPSAQHTCIPHIHTVCSSC